MIRDHSIYRFAASFDAEEWQSVPGTGETERTGRRRPMETTVNIIAKSERKAKAAFEDKFQYASVENLKYEIVEVLNIDVLLFEPTW